MDSESLNRSCARCGAPMHCGAVGGDARCWCEDLPALQPLAGGGCLCPACLREALKEQAHKT